MTHTAEAAAYVLSDHRIAPDAPLRCGCGERLRTDIPAHDAFAHHQADSLADAGLLCTGEPGGDRETG